MFFGDHFYCCSGHYKQDRKDYYNSIEYFKKDLEDCDEFMRHKSTLVNPRLLEKNGIPVRRTIQRAGEVCFNSFYNYLYILLYYL